MKELTTNDILTTGNVNWEKVREEMGVKEPRYFRGKPLVFWIEWWAGSMVIRYGSQTLYIHRARHKEFIKKN